jgi:hypothetical protein
LDFAAQQGSFHLEHDTVELDMRGLSAAPVEVRVDGALFVHWSYTEARLQVRLPPTTRKLTVEIDAP